MIDAAGEFANPLHNSAAFKTSALRHFPLLSMLPVFASRRQQAHLLKSHGDVS
jgi:hypothetical protein